MSSAWHRGFDQLEALGVHHSGLVDVVESSSVWAISAAAAAALRWPDEPKGLANALRGFAFQLEELLGQMRLAALVWAGTLADVSQSAAFLQPGLASSSGVTLVPPLRRAVSEGLEPQARARYDGRHLEGCLLLQRMRQDRAAWAAEAVDAVHFLVAGGIPTHRLPTYVAAVEATAAAAEKKLELAYMSAVEAFYRRTLVLEDERQDHRPEARFYGGLGVIDWMHALADGGIERPQRETVLCGLSSTYPVAVDAARRATASRN